MHRYEEGLRVFKIWGFWSNSLLCCWWILVEVLSTSTRSLCCTCFCVPWVRLEDQRSRAGEANAEPQAKDFLHTAPSLFILYKEAGAAMVVKSEIVEGCQAKKH